MGRLTAGVIATVIAAIGLSLTAVRTPWYRHTAHGMLNVETACQAVITRSLIPEEIKSCERSDVHLQLRPYCPSKPLNVVLVLMAQMSPSAEPLARAWTVAAAD